MNSSILHDNLEKLLSKIISHNQFEFMNGKSITENVLLAWKIITNIRKISKPTKMVIRLNIGKAYDMVN